MTTWKKNSINFRWSKKEIVALVVEKKKLYFIFVDIISGSTSASYIKYYPYWRKKIDMLMNKPKEKVHASLHNIFHLVGFDFASFRHKSTALWKPFHQELLQCYTWLAKIEKYPGSESTKERTRSKERMRKVKTEKIISIHAIPLLSIENVIWWNKLPHRMRKGHDNRWRKMKKEKKRNGKDRKREEERSVEKKMGKGKRKAPMNKCYLFS